MRKFLALAACLLGAALLGGCIMPNGRPVIVEQRTGDYWSGNGVLLETSEDGLRCRVAVRDTALVLETSEDGLRCRVAVRDTALVVGKKWVPCKYVHARRVRR
jgi:hypothetical protein